MPLLIFSIVLFSQQQWGQDLHFRIATVNHYALCSVPKTLCYLLVKAHIGYLCEYFCLVNLYLSPDAHQSLTMWISPVFFCSSSLWCFFWATCSFTRSETSEKTLTLSILKKILNTNIKLWGNVRNCHLKLTNKSPNCFCFHLFSINNL